AVVMNPRTGKVYALATQPTYDPNLVEKHFNQIKASGAPCQPAAPLLNRATDGLFTPGSTFKVVTATAALNSHKFTPDSTFYDPGYCTEYGKQVSNAASPDGPVESFGHPTLAMGLQHSINSVFCNVGDRKSTRLNSSHRTISYAVFCLKKKKQEQGRRT